MDKPADPVFPAIDGLIDRLHARGRPRVWSLVVTIFGDAVVPRGGRAPLTLLQDILARLRIEPGAVRTAMSRLAADGWVLREKDGRKAYYRLAEQGRHAFDLATRRIYAGGPPEWKGEWTVAMAGVARDAESGLMLQDLGFARVAPGVHLRAETTGAAEIPPMPGMLIVRGAARQNASSFADLWDSARVAAAYRQFHELFLPLSEQLNASASLAAADAMALRTLLIHDWRRIVLRDPGLPAELLPPDWPAEASRALCRRIYALTTSPSEAFLDRAGLPRIAEPDRFARRFVPAQSSR